MMRGVIAAGFILTFGIAPAGAQPPNPVAVDVRVGGFVSIQPAGYDGTGGPYLRNSLGGIVPGVNAAVGIRSAGRSLLTVELGSTSSLEAVQSGRFVVGLGPVRARHRDTLLSILPGVRFQVRSATIEAKGGLSLLFGTPQREAFQYDDPGGAIALTAGIDVVAPLGNRLGFVPSARYSLANRGDNALYFGLGKHIVRVGAALRLGLTE